MLRHFQAAKQYGLLTVGEVLGDVEGQRGLAHAGARSDQHQLAAPQSRQGIVQRSVTRLLAEDSLARLVRCTNLSEQHVQIIGECGRVGVVVPLDGLAQCLLGHAYQFVKLSGSLPSELRDSLPRFDESAQSCLLADDLRVEACVRRCSDELGEFVHPHSAPGLL